MSTYLGTDMTEADKLKAAAEKEAAEKDAPKAFTKMTNITKKPLYLACGTVQPGETVAYNNAEYSTLYLFLEAK
jgi:hypothetical protein